MIRAGRQWRGELLLLLLTFVPAALALDPHSTLDHFGHQVWRTDSGLPQNTVHTVLQTRDGYLWLGTDGGLVRFNGLDFVTFASENTPQLPSDTIYDLLQDGSGTLWISTASGLVSYRSGAFTAYSTAQGLPAETVWFTYEDHRHRLWAITSAGPATFDGQHFIPVAGAQAAGPLNRQALAEDGQGTLWLGGSSGVFVFDTTERTPRLKQHLLNSIETEAIVLDRQGNVWMGTGEGLKRYAGGTLTPLSKTEVTALEPDADGSMWVGGATGLAFPSPHKASGSKKLTGCFATIRESSGLPANEGYSGSRASSSSPSPQVLLYLRTGCCRCTKTAKATCGSAPTPVA
jgi:ligand-binding sensor domain-containing protein